MTFETEYRAAGEMPSVRETLMGGIGAGVLAGSLMLLVLVANSVSHRHVWWMLPNVLGSTFYGARALRAGGGLVSLAGVALHLLISGLIGGLFAGFSLRILKTRRLLWLSLFVTMLWYFLAYQLIWARVNPLIPLYATEPSTAVAHVIFAFTMGRSLMAFLPQTAEPPVAGTWQAPPELPPPIPPPAIEPPNPEVPHRAVSGQESQTAPEGPVQLE